MRTFALLSILLSNFIYGQQKMETRAEMTLDQFKEIGPYTDPEYLTFNYEENLFEHIRNQLLNHNATTYNSLTKGQKLLWGYITLSSQIRNGGIAQYYWNYEDEYINDFNLFLSVINDKEFAKLLNKSKETYIKNRYLVSNYKHLDEQPNKLHNYYRLWIDVLKGDDLDKYFFTNATKLEKAVYDYIISNPAEFIKLP
jgi:hypothetical protein